MSPQLLQQTSGMHTLNTIESGRAATMTPTTRAGGKAAVGRSLETHCEGSYEHINKGSLGFGSHQEAPTTKNTTFRGVMTQR